MTSVSGKVLWLRAKDLSLSNEATVTSWADASASLASTKIGTNDAKFEAAATPEGGPAVRFTNEGAAGAGFRYSFTRGAGPGELWIVLRNDGSSGTNAGSWSFYQGIQPSHFTYSGEVYENAGASTRHSFTFPSGSYGDFIVYRVRADGTTWKAFIDGVEVASVSDGSPQWDSTYAYVGISNGTPSTDTAFRGAIAELLAFDDALDSTDEATVWDYLQAEHFGEPPPSGSATLTVTSGGSASLGGLAYAEATLTVTSGGAATVDGGTLPEVTATTLTVTSGGAATIGEGSSVYTTAVLAVTTGGAATLGVTASATATLAAATSGSAWLGRTWTPDPVTGRGAYTLTVTDRAGTPLASLDSAYITRAIVDRLNDVDGTGSGTAFTVPDSDTVAHANLRQYRELQVARGGHHLGTYVLLNPDDTGTASSVSWQAAGLGHYLTKRRIGPAVRPGLLTKQWRAGFREGSIPPAPPKWSRPGTPALVGPALRVEGSTYVQRTVTRLGADTTFAFGSYVLTGTGKDALRAFADEIVVDTDLNDLVDIEPPTVTIEGHTDNVPYTSHPGGNQWLSEQRANAVRDFLAPLVPEGTTLVAVGYGATRPVASNATSAGRQANRRVDLTYPKTESARGHRQYLQDTLVYTNPSAHIKRVLTFVSWWSLESYKEPNADGSVIWLGRRPVGSTDDDAWTEADWVDIDAETPLNTWTRSEVSITVPADGQAWEIVARLTPPAGTIVYDEGATELYADDALEFIDVDQALIVKGLVEHAQDPAFDKDDLGIATDTPLTGIKRTRVYYWHERATISDCLEELVNISGGMDLTWQTTPTTRTLVSHYPRAGQVTSASLHAGPERTVDDYQISLNGAAAATTVIVQADGSGSDREEGVMQGVPDDLDLVLEEVWTAEPGTHVGELNAQAQRGHRHYGGHVPIVTATVRQERTDEWLDRVHLGDVIDVNLPARVRHVTGPHRVTARSLDPIADRVIVSPTVEV